MARTKEQNILKFSHALDFFLKMQFPKCKLRLLEPLKQPQLKVKMFLERETLYPNKKYLVNSSCFAHF